MNKNLKSLITNLSHLRESFEIGSENDIDLSHLKKSFKNGSENDTSNDTSNDVIDKSYRIFQKKIPKSFITNIK